MNQARDWLANTAKKGTSRKQYCCNGRVFSPYSVPNWFVRTWRALLQPWAVLPPAEAGGDLSMPLSWNAEAECIPCDVHICPIYDSRFGRRWCVLAFALCMWCTQTMFFSVLQIGDADATNRPGTYYAARAVDHMVEPQMFRSDELVVLSDDASHRQP